MELWIFSQFGQSWIASDPAEVHCVHLNGPLNLLDRGRSLTDPEVCNGEKEGGDKGGIGFMQEFLDDLPGLPFLDIVSRGVRVVSSTR